MWNGNSSPEWRSFHRIQNNSTDNNIINTKRSAKQQLNQDNFTGVLSSFRKTTFILKDTTLWTFHFIYYSNVELAVSKSLTESSHLKFIKVLIGKCFIYINVCIDCIRYGTNMWVLVELSINCEERFLFFWGIGCV